MQARDLTLPETILSGDFTSDTDSFFFKTTQERSYTWLCGMRRQMMYSASKRLNKATKIENKKWVCVDFFQRRVTTSLVCQSGLIGVSERKQMENMGQISVTPGRPKN